MRLVLDASAAVRLVMCVETAERLLGPVSVATVVIAPSLYAGEVANTLKWEYGRAGRLEAKAALERYQEAIDLIDDFTPRPVARDRGPRGSGTVVAR